jgi:hypothetical protein
LCGEDIDYDQGFFKKHTFFTHHLKAEK